MQDFVGVLIDVELSRNEVNWLNHVCVNCVHVGRDFELMTCGPFLHFVDVSPIHGFLKMTDSRLPYY